MDNYSKPLCGLAEFNIVNLWFKSVTLPTWVLKR